MTSHNSAPSWFNRSAQDLESRKLCAANKAILGSSKSQERRCIFMNSPAQVKTARARLGPSYAASTAPLKTPCTIRRTRRGTGSFHRHKGHDDPRRQCWLSRRVARAASPAATPPCGYGLSRNRQLLGAVTSNPPSPAVTCVSTIRQLPLRTAVRSTVRDNRCTSFARAARFRPQKPGAFVLRIRKQP
jgi:hypothetical protein